jgi:hypothetical protein
MIGLPESIAPDQDIWFWNQTQFEQALQAVCVRSTALVRIGTPLCRGLSFLLQWDNDQKYDRYIDANLSDPVV